MKLFAIADPHLSAAQPKPMDIFGSNWTDHFERMKAAWREVVTDDDVVLIPGDISWAMQLSDAKLDLDALGELPGRSLILRGNHDYWWNSVSKVRAHLPPGMQALQNDAFRFGKFVIAGTRLWTCPGSQHFEGDDAKIYTREVGRLELSLRAAEKMRTQEDVLVVMLHFPPFNEKREENEVMALIAEHRADVLLYGHLHGKSTRGAFEGDWNGCCVRLVSADHVNFTPQLIGEDGAQSE